MIIFKKILSYPTRPLDGDAFSYLCQLTLQQINPPSLQPGQLQLDAPVVYHSPLQRAVECLNRIPSTTYIGSPALAEVRFDLHRLCGRSAWEKEGSVAVRRGFKQAFIDDKLSQPRGELIKQTAAVLQEAYSASTNQSVGVVSHSFRLKLIEAFIQTKGQLATSPELISAFIDDSHKTFGWGAGFRIQRADLAGVEDFEPAIKPL